MKIAVTYDNGNIFQHFGRTESFKVYEVEDGKVISSEVIGSDGIGHGALAGLLAGNAVPTVTTITMKKATSAAAAITKARTTSAAEGTEKAADAAADMRSSSRWKERMRERASEYTTEGPLTTARSLTLPMTAERLWILSAAQV